MSLRHAILGFLSVQPMSGYDLKRFFDETVGHFWTADQAQIYRTLTRLTDDGLVESRHIAQAGRPDRFEHDLTEAGRQELDDWLQTPLDPHPVREAFLLQVFFVGRLGIDQATRLVAERLVEAERASQMLDAITAAVATEPADDSLEQLLRMATLDNGIRHTHAEIEWSQALLERLNSEPVS